MNPNVYAQGIYIKKNPKFEGLNISIKTSDFVTFLQANTNEKGYCNIVINPRKEPTEFGNTHYCKLNNWEPDKSTNDTEPLKNIKTVATETVEDCGNLPF